MKKLFLLVVFVTSIYNSSQAQTPLFKVLADVEGVEKNTNYDFPKEKIGANGGGYSLDPTMLTKPVQKIALVTFFLEDPGTALNGSLWRATDELGQKFIDGFYKQGIDPLVQKFKSEGIDLLLPNQFLDSPEKKEFYKNFVVEHTSLKKEKTESSAKHRTKDADNEFVAFGTKSSTVERLKVTASSSEMKPLFLINEGVNINGVDAPPLMMTSSGLLTDKKMMTSLGFDMAQQLGVDAVLCIWVVSMKPSGSYELYGLQAISGYLFGPNPIQREDGDDKGLTYARGLFYCGTRATFKEVLIFQSMDKKKKPEEPNYTGFENAMTVMAGKMSAYLKTGKRK